MAETFTMDDLSTAAKFAAAAMWRILRPSPAEGEAEEFLVHQAAHVGVVDALIVKDLLTKHAPAPDLLQVITHVP